MAKLTVRAIAAAAGVNVAAVSYYFGSKEALLQAAREATLRHILEDTEVILGRSHPPAEAFAELLHYYLEGALRYPRTRASVVCTSHWPPCARSPTAGPTRQGWRPRCSLAIRGTPGARRGRRAATRAETRRRQGAPVPRDPFGFLSCLR